MSDYNITLFEACELLNRSKKSISRYIRKGLLHPEQIKSKQGTLEYRFSKADLEAFKAQEALKAEQTRPDGTDQTDRTEQTEQTGQPNLTQDIEIQKSPEQTRQDRIEQARQDRTLETDQKNEIITLLKETTGLLKEQLKTKDEQISSLGVKIDQLIERDRETNIILKGLQDKILALEPPKQKQEQTGQDRGDGTRQDQPKTAKADIWKQLFKKRIL